MSRTFSNCLASAIDEPPNFATFSMGPSLLQRGKEALAVLHQRLRHERVHPAHGHGLRDDRTVPVALGEAASSGSAARVRT